MIRRYGLPTPRAIRLSHLAAEVWFWLPSHLPGYGRLIAAAEPIRTFNAYLIKRSSTKSTDGVTPIYGTSFIFHSECSTSTQTLHLGSIHRRVSLIRFESGRRFLEDGASVTRISTRCGFGSTEVKRRSFLRHLGVGPNAYRNRFHG